MDIRHFIAGWGAGMFGVIIGHPMDTVKTYQQISNRRLSTPEVLKLIIRTEGLKGLYKGMFFPLISAGALNAIYFGVLRLHLNFAQNKRGHEEIDYTNHRYIEDLFISGTVGGSAQALLSCPTELIKTRMQAGKVKIKYSIVDKTLMPKPSTYLTVLDIFKKYGIRGFYVGLVPTVYRDAIGGGIYMTVYQTVRYYLSGKSSELGVLAMVIASGLAGFFSWIPVVPFDTIKSRLQADDFKNRNFKGMTDCAIDLFNKSRYRGFYKGIFMISVRAVPVNIAIIYAYEFILLIMEYSEKEF